MEMTENKGSWLGTRDIILGGSTQQLLAFYAIKLNSATKLAFVVVRPVPVRIIGTYIVIPSFDYSH